MDDRIERGGLGQIDITSMWKDVLRQWWVIVLISLSVAMLYGSWLTFTFVPSYSVSATFTVSSKGLYANAYQDMSSAQTVAKRFSVVLDSSILQSRIEDELGMDAYTAETSAEVVESTNMITLNVTADSAGEAYHVIHAILNNYTEITDFVVEDVVLEMIQAPTVPESPSNSFSLFHVMRNAAAVAALVCIAFFAFLSYMKDTVKNEKEVSEKVDAKLLGTIYHEKKVKSLRNIKKAGTLSMLIQNPMLSFRFVEGSRMAASRVRSQMTRRGAQTLLVTSVLENEGKSTVAANLALSLAQEGKKTLLIDCDFRKPAQYKIFEIPEEETVDFLGILKNRQGLQNIIRQWQDSNLYLICNGTALPNKEEIQGNELLGAVLTFLKKRMDYIIIDTSPMALVADAEEIARVVDASLLVMKQDLVYAKDINDAIDALNRIGAPVIGCIFNDVSAGLTTRAGHYGYGGNYGYGGYYGKRTKE